MCPWQRERPPSWRAFPFPTRVDESGVREPEVGGKIGLEPGRVAVGRQHKVEAGIHQVGQLLGAKDPARIVHQIAGRLEILVAEPGLVVLSDQVQDLLLDAGCI